MIKKCYERKKKHTKKEENDWRNGLTRKHE